MYEQFFGLQSSAFSMSPDPRFLMLTAAHREALAGLIYATLGRKGIVVLTGDAGTGKTTLIRKLLQTLPGDKIRYGLVLNPTLTPSEFLEMVMVRFGIDPIPDSKAQRLMRLQDFLVRTYKEGRVALIVVDEAHKISPELLEEIRLLTNLESTEHKLLQIVLAGQNELDDLLRRPELRQMKQRVALRLTVAPLPRPEIDRYLEHRWKLAGGAAPAPFDAQAVAAMARWSHGIPRLINVLSDASLLAAFAAEATKVTAEHIAQAAADLDLIPVSAPDKAAMAPAKDPAPETPPAPKPVMAPSPMLAASPLSILRRQEPPPEKKTLGGSWFMRLGWMRGRS